VNTFDPVAAAGELLAEFKVGDIVPADTVTELTGTRLPVGNDTFAVGQELVFERLQRVGALREELLKTHKILAISENHALELVRPEHQVDAALRRVKLKTDQVLRRGVNEVANLDMAGLPNLLIAEQHDAMTYLDALRLALNPRSRRLKVANVTPLKIAP
jgi:hypothetical protein